MKWSCRSFSSTPGDNKADLSDCPYEAQGYGASGAGMMANPETRARGNLVTGPGAPAQCTL